LTASSQRDWVVVEITPNIVDRTDLLYLVTL